MKKTLLALAALAATSAAFAQSSVTVYGVADVSLESVKGDKTVTRVQSDNLASSRLGFKGTEDIGGGVKANFVLEHNVKVDTGAQGNARMWDRAAWVGLSSTSLGEVRLGRIDTPIGDIAGNVLGAQAYDDLKLVPTRAGNSYRRTDNAITYIAPALVPGLTTTLQYSTDNSGTTTGGETPGSSYGKSYGLSLKYAAGPISAGLGYQSVKDDAAAANSQKANATLVYAAYDLGVAKVTGYYDSETDPTNAKGRRLSVLGAKVSVPVSPEFTAIVGASQARNVAGSAAGTDNVEIFSLKGIYSLSKRTAVYGLFTNVNNGKATKLGVLAPTTTDKTTNGLAVGVRHMF